MKFKLSFEKVNEKLRELWKYRIFKVAIIVQLSYIIFSLIFTIFFLKDLSDFYVYYKSAGIFIDEANLFYSQKFLGWRVNWQRISEFFSQFYNIKIAQYYMGMPTRREAYEQNILIKNQLSNLLINY